MNDQVTNAIIFGCIPALVFLALVLHFTVNKQAARDATAEMAAYDALPVPPPLPLIDVDLNIIVTDASGQRWRVHFGVMDVQMVEDGE